ncbi:hypothetical protein ECG_09781 [Echinococcus granulosus]|uniref:Expressed protein n=1 Tax=Echinococcus granulosus TaxID=6210 RepID=A0A068WX89_ECHGR|nr:hypothetical protein ECG_09781 [Echinococcus granulosus]CDS24775.1 expressed protein [Echinococcus granulosus]
MQDLSGGFVTDPFLKSVLFTQVFKASVALSILHACPTHLEADDFTKRLRMSHRFYQRYKDRSFYHANQVKLSLVDDFNATNYHIGPYNCELSLDSQESVLSQLTANVISIRVGFRGLLETKDPIREKYIVPGLFILVKTLFWMDKCCVELKETSLLNQVARLHAEASDAFKVTGEIVAKLDTEELSTAEVFRCFAFMLSSAFSVKEGGCSNCWIYPVKSFVKSYLRFTYENADDVGTLCTANSLTEHLLNHISRLLQLSHEDSRLQTQCLNESFARVYSLAMPLLSGFRRKSHISRSLIDAVSETTNIIRQIKVCKTEDTWLSNGSLVLLQSIKSKLQRLNDLYN